MADGLASLLREITACRACAAEMPHAPRPVLHIGSAARLLIISQAPGRRVHETGISFNDRSGDRLRSWLGLSRAEFYDTSQVAIMGMAFCYPGTDAMGGDLPPSRRCAPLWHDRILPLLRDVELTLLVGSYAQRRYLEASGSRDMTETVARWREFLPRFFMLPHPSWRNVGWIARHPWFEAELLPELRRRVAATLVTVPEAATSVAPECIEIADGLLAS